MTMLPLLKTHKNDIKSLTAERVLKFKHRVAKNPLSYQP